MQREDEHDSAPSPESCSNALDPATAETDTAHASNESAPSTSAATTNATSLDPLSPNLDSARVDLDEFAWRSLTEQYNWHRDHNPVYQRWCNWHLPSGLLPDGVMSKYREEVKVAQAEDREPSIALDLLLLHEAFGEERWEPLRMVQKVEETRSKEVPLSLAGPVALQYINVKEQQQKRFEEIMWLDDLWSRCLAFEAEHDVAEEQRVRQRFKRFHFGVFPTLAERNEAERRAEEGEK